MSALNKDMEEVESMRKQLAEFFCEDPVSFKLEECFKVLIIYLYFIRIVGKIFFKHGEILCVCKNI